jgi:hypothetical protein
MPQYGRPYSNWATGVGAGVLALLALLELRLKAWQARRQAAAGSTNATGNASRSTGSASSDPAGESDPRWTSSTTHDDDTGHQAGGTRFTPPPQPPPTVRVEVIREKPVPPSALTAPLRALGPGRSTETGSAWKGSPMSDGSKFPLLTVAMEFAGIAAKYKPSSAHDLAPEFDKLPEVVAYIAAGFRHYARRIDAEEPVEQPVIDVLFEVFNGINKLVTSAEQVGPLHRKIHTSDIARQDAPRRNEDRWDVRR